PGLVYQGMPDRQLIIKPKDPERRPTIRLKYDPELREEGDAIPVWTALTIKSGNVTVRNLRFEVDATQAQILMAAVTLLEGGRLTLENCEFAQIDPPHSEPGRLSSVVVANAKVDIHGCYFNGLEKTAKPSGTTGLDNQDAVTLEGGAYATVKNCAFGP